MDLDDDSWRSVLRDLSKHVWHGQAFFTVGEHLPDDVMEATHAAVLLLNDYPGWDICVWQHWNSGTSYELSWSCTSQEARDSVVSVLRGMPKPGARHIYTCWAANGMTIQPTHWKEVQ